MAVALLGLALTAFQSDALAQTRRGGSSATRSTSTSRPTSTVKSNTSTSSATRGSKVNKSSATVSRPSTTVTKPTASTRPTSTATRPSTSTATRPTKPQATKPQATKPQTTQPQVTKPQTRPTTSPAATRPVTRPTTKPTAKPTTTPTTKPSTKPTTKPESTKPVTRPSTKPGNVTRPARPADKKPGGMDVRPDIRPDRPVQIRPDHKHDAPRVHPRDRDFLHYSRPSYYWTGHNHCYGHRVRVLPSYAHRHVYHGVTYYCYNDIWYRPYAGYYVVCRPPFGTVLAANLIADMTWAAINFSYYSTVAQTYSQISENNEYIAQQNAIIAQNNATIAAQNAQIAAGQQQAQAAYTLANQLGLIQSYAAAGSSYYYQDGVFYSMDANGQYSVIVPPAGALVETLPEDYDMITLADGNEYYMVDDTVYKVTIVEGKPYFEVLGQLYR